MDGVGAKKNIFFVGATNRPEILDEALLRPVNIYAILGKTRSTHLYSFAGSTFQAGCLEGQPQEDADLQRCRFELHRPNYGWIFGSRLN